MMASQPPFKVAFNILQNQGKRKRAHLKKCQAKNSLAPDKKFCQITAALCGF
jgi:hypothetical protein